MYFKQDVIHEDAVIAIRRMDDAMSPFIAVARNKVVAAARQRRATSALGEGFEGGGDPGWDGGDSIIVNGSVMSAINFSGLTGCEDGQLARTGRDAMSNRLLKAGASK